MQEEEQKKTEVSLLGWSGKAGQAQVIDLNVGWADRNTEVLPLSAHPRKEDIWNISLSGTPQGRRL